MLDKVVTRLSRFIKLCIYRASVYNPKVSDYGRYLSCAGLVWFVKFKSSSKFDWLPSVMTVYSRLSLKIKFTNLKWNKYFQLQRFRDQDLFQWYPPRKFVTGSDWGFKTLVIIVVGQIRDSNDVRKMLKSFVNNIVLDYDNCSQAHWWEWCWIWKYM